MRAELASQGKEEAAVNAFISHVQSACPGAVPASPKTGTAAQQRAWQALPSSAPTAIDLADRMKPLADPQARAAIGRLATLEGRVSNAFGRFTFAAFDRMTSALSS